MNYARTMRSFALAAAAIACFAASGNLVAATGCSMPNCVTYNVQGQFSTTVVSGMDTFKLAGQKFNININDVSEHLKPSSHGKGYADYKNLNMSGYVYSGLDPSQVPLSSTATSVEFALVPAKSYDLFALYVPVKVLGLTFTISASIQAPLNTIKSPLVPQPLASSVTLTTTTTAVTYTYTPATGGGPQTTALTIESGTLSSTVVTNPTTGGQTASLQAGAPGMPAAVILRADAAVPARKQDLA